MLTRLPTNGHRNMLTTLLARMIGRPHVFVYRLAGGQVGGRIRGAPVLLLTTRGRRSGRLVTVPLLYAKEGESVVVIASYGGSPTHPAWYLNLRKEQLCLVQIKRRRWSALAEDVVGEHRALLWTQAVSMYPGYQAYMARTRRKIPVVRLRPVAELG